MNVPEVTNVKNNAPTASVFINGLSLICFSSNNDRAEVGLLKVPNMPHNYEIKIYKGDCDNLIWDSGSIGTAALENSVLVINSDNVGAGKRFENSGGREYDDEDIRWTVDLDDEHGQSLNFTSDAEDYIFSRIHINNGIFYTKVKSTYEAKLHKENDPATEKWKDFVGKVAGVAIDDEEVKIELQLFNDSRIIVATMKKSDGPFFVYISYLCPGAGSTAGDFIRNYDVMELPGSAQYKYDLKFDDRERDWEYCENSGGGAAPEAVEEACQPTISGWDYKDLPF